MVFIHGSEITQKISRSVQFLAFSLTQHVKTEASKTVSSGKCIHQHFSALYNSFSITRVPKCGLTRFRSDFHIANRRRHYRYYVYVEKVCFTQFLTVLYYYSYLIYISYIIKYYILLRDEIITFQVAAGSVTCLAVFGPSGKVNKVTGNLPLLTWVTRKTSNWSCNQVYGLSTLYIVWFYYSTHNYIKSSDFSLTTRYRI